MAINQNQKSHRGISIIEILITIAIISIALTSLLGVATFTLKISTLLKETNQANNLAQETIEAVRNFRDGTTWNTNGLGVLTTGVSYHLQKSADTPAKWQLIQGEEIINNFTRKVIFSTVMRDTNDNIIEAGGTVDPNTKKVTATVSWKEKKVEIVTYLTNWQ